MGQYSFDHVHVFVADINALGMFLVDVFEAEQLQKSDARFDVRFGAGKIFISPASATEKSDPKAGGSRIDHFGLLVHDLEAVAANLRQRGVTFRQEPQTVRPGVKAAFVQAPGGIVIELLERR